MNDGYKDEERLRPMTEQAKPTFDQERIGSTNDLSILIHLNLLDIKKCCLVF